MEPRTGLSWMTRDLICGATCRQKLLPISFCNCWFGKVSSAAHDLALVELCAQSVTYVVDKQHILILDNFEV
jgi:hypothetical protein